MISLKLKTIADFIPSGSTVLDVGTDHAYLPIYLAQNKKVKKVYASDISKGAVEIAKKNISKSKEKIDIFLSDGLKNIKVKYNYLVIAGMGTSTIIHILESGKLPDNIILSSNNNLYELRCYMNKIGYILNNEKVILEHKKYYDIMVFKKGKEYLTRKELLFGKSNNQEYYKYLINKNKVIIKKCNLKNKLRLYKENIILKSLIK